jgi:hypothetical protein
MIKRTNLRIHRVEEEVELQHKGTENLLTEIIVENFPDPCNNIDTHVQEVF